MGLSGNESTSNSNQLIAAHSVISEVKFLIQQLAVCGSKLGAGWGYRQPWWGQLTWVGFLILHSHAYSGFGFKEEKSNAQRTTSDLQEVWACEALAIFLKWSTGSFWSQVHLVPRTISRQHQWSVGSRRLADGRQENEQGHFVVIPYTPSPLHSQSSPLIRHLSQQPYTQSLSFRGP